VAEGVTHRMLATFYNRLHAGVNSRLRTFAGGRFAEYCRPTTIAILLTERCNARCLHCDIWKNRGKEDYPTIEQWKTTLRDLRRWLGPVQVTCTGGEALLMPWATELIAFSSSIGLLIEHLTHGYWLDQSRVEKLARARPWRITISCDGIGATHDKIRGRQHFFESVLTTIDTIQRVGGEIGHPIPIRLKTVVMEHNLHDVGNIARFAKERGLEVFYQPIEQYYNTPEDPDWHQQSSNWPRDPERAVEAVRELIALKRQGFPIANHYDLLDVMIPYFRNPDALRVTVQAHTHLYRPQCAALTNLQIQSNGDVGFCFRKPPAGNIKSAPIRRIWADRPRLWESGCCQMSPVPAPTRPADEVLQH
jgi:MoaA/NifB/PqqE/SkfB family radical SAM enzyme